ncbi:hypothetical protein [Acidovorax sp. LjRoot117]|uniref:hypothetical protein n=1 Tax=Acidovorax sp. LjRoot117 TaxID=3342255 RepID=UPI003ECE32E8
MQKCESHANLPKAKNQNIKIIAIALILAEQSISMGAEACTHWKEVSDKFTTQKSKFTLITNNSEAIELSYLKKIDNQIYLKELKSFQKISLEDALLGLKMQNLEFHLPLTSKDCLKIGDVIKKKINGFEITITHPQENYFLSFVENNKKTISDAILEIEK